MAWSRNASAHVEQSCSTLEEAPAALHNAILELAGRVLVSGLYSLAGQPAFWCPMARSPADDTTLWARARSGDGEARTQLAELCEEIATRELGARGLRAADLADLTQESVRSMLAYLSGSTLSGPTDAPRDLGAFLKFRTLGVLSDYRKKMRATRLKVQLDDGIDPQSDEPGPERQARTAQLQEALDDCRGRLDEGQGQVLRLRYDDHEETEAIATMLGLHRNTINVRVFRALENLRDCMRRKGFEAGDLA